MQKSAPKIVQKKSASNTHLFQCREAPGEAASRTRFLNKKQLSGQETTTTAHFWVHFWAVVLEWVISESMSGKLLICWWNLKQKRQVIAEVFAYCPFPKVDDLTRSGPRPGEFLSPFLENCSFVDESWNRKIQFIADLLLSFSFQRPMIWHALGQGPANYYR